MVVTSSTVGSVVGVTGVDDAQPNNAVTANQAHAWRTIVFLEPRAACASVARARVVVKRGASLRDAVFCAWDEWCGRFCLHTRCTARAVTRRALHAIAKCNLYVS